MAKCIICEKEFYERQGMSYCQQCCDKIKLAKKIDMVSKAEQLIYKKPKELRRFKNDIDVSEFSEIVRQRILQGVDVFSSIPEVVVAIQMQKIKLEYQSQKLIAGKKVDFYIPEIKIVLEIDGELYHTDENKSFLRDRQIMHELGEKWEIVHIKANQVPRYTWNLREALPYVVAQRNEQWRFRDSALDSDFLQDFRKLEFYLGGIGNENTRLFKPN